MDMRNNLKPYAITYSEKFDYDVRAEALRLLGAGDAVGAAINDTLAHPKLPEILLCLAHMGFGGIVDYYSGNCGPDDEAARWCVSREHMMCDELANIEAELLQTYERTPELKAQLKAELAQRETGTRAALAQIPYPPSRHSLPPGTVPSPRAIAILRQRERDEQ